MKDLILNFSWDKLISLPPSELLALVFLAVLTLVLIIGLCAVVVSVLEG